MKIYCARGINSIRDFIGKDVWVKVHDSSHYCDEYARFLSIDSDDIVEYNFLFYKYVENIDLYSNYISVEDVDKILSTKRYAPISELELFEPLQILTTDEIVEIFENYRYYMG